MTTVTARGYDFTMEHVYAGAASMKGNSFTYVPRAEGQTASGSAAEKAAPSSGELEQVKEQIRLAEAVLQNARKRLNELDGPARTGKSRYPGGPTVTPSPSIATPEVGNGTATAPTFIANDPNRVPAMGIPGSSGMPAMGSTEGRPPSMSSAPAERLRRIEQLAEELRREVEALRRESQPTTAPTPTR